MVLCPSTSGTISSHPFPQFITDDQIQWPSQLIAAYYTSGEYPTHIARKRLIPTACSNNGEGPDKKSDWLWNDVCTWPAHTIDSIKKQSWVTVKSVIKIQITENLTHSGLSFETTLGNIILESNLLSRIRSSMNSKECGVQFWFAYPKENMIEEIQWRVFGLISWMGNLTNGGEIKQIVPIPSSSKRGHAKLYKIVTGLGR